MFQLWGVHVRFLFADSGEWSTSGQCPRHTGPALGVSMDLSKLATLPVGWNGYDALPATPDVCANAQQWINRFEQEVRGAGLQWEDPNALPFGDGLSVCFEWWCTDRKLNIDVGTSQLVDCFIVMGSGVNAPIDDREADTPEQRIALWRWLRGAT